MGAKAMGARVRRMEDPALLTGRAVFTDDIHLPGMLEAAFVRSTHAHARIRSVDTSAAESMPGVFRVVTTADLPTDLRTVRVPFQVPNPAITQPFQQRLLEDEEVCFVGEPIAMVLADTRYRAEDAAAAVAVDYEVLPAASDCRDALADDTKPCHADSGNNLCAEFKLGYGDAAAAFASAEHTFEVSLWSHRGAGLAIENRAIVAEPDRLRDVVTLWSATQSPFLVKQNVVDMLDWPADRLRVIAPEVGGGFGPKTVYYVEEALIPLCAMLFDRPIKWVEDRRENFVATNQERDQYWDMALACDGEGKILAVRGAMIHDTGAYMPWGIISPYISATTVPGPYVVPAYELTTRVALTNKVAVTPVRGAGRPQAVFAMERLLDRAADGLGIDRAEIRRRNFIPTEAMPYSFGLIFRDGKPMTYDSGDYPRCQAEALALADYDGFADRRAKAEAEGRHLGIGIANFVEGTGLGPFEGATVRVHANGKVTVYTGGGDSGQGHWTTLAQLCAEPLGVDPQDITVEVGDTGKIANGIGTFASRNRRQRGQFGPSRRDLGTRKGDQDRLPPARSGRGGPRHRGRAHLREGRTRRLDHVAGRRPGGARDAGLFASRRRRARSRIDGVFLAAASRLLQRHRRGRGRGRSRNGQHRDTELRDGARFGKPDQPVHRRRAGPGRLRARHRQHPARMDGLRRRCSAADHDLRRLPAAGRARRTADRRGARRIAHAEQPAGRQGSRRGGYDTGARRDRRRGRGRPQPVRHRARRRSDHAGASHRADRPTHGRARGERARAPLQAFVSST